MTEAKPCIACGKVLRNVTDDSVNQPYEGTAFTSAGHYGSTVFDPMDGSYLEIIVCDECLVAHRDRVLIGRSAKPVMYEGSMVGFCRTPNRPLMDWTGDEPPAYHDGANNILHVDEDDLRHPERLPEITWNVPPADLL